MNYEAIKLLRKSGGTPTKEMLVTALEHETKLLEVAEETAKLTEAAFEKAKSADGATYSQAKKEDDMAFEQVVAIRRHHSKLKKWLGIEEPKSTKTHPSAFPGPQSKLKSFEEIVDMILDAGFEIPASANSRRDDAQALAHKILGHSGW